MDLPPFTEFGLLPAGDYSLSLNQLRGSSLVVSDPGYRVELYPHFGQLAGISDEFGNDLQFPAAFRKSRTEHRQKGIVKLLKD